LIGGELSRALSGGVPSVSDLDIVEDSDLFRTMLQASDSWLERNAALLALTQASGLPTRCASGVDVGNTRS
jgi:hypothetical protein